MSSRIQISRYTGTYWENIEKLRKAIAEADSIVIGAGAGLSTAAGFTYSGERFEKYFADFEEKYDFHDMYSGAFHRFETPQIHWAYWSRFIMVNRYMDPPTELYKELLELVKDKDYFVITTNVDHCFQKAGFDKDRLFYTQGDYGLFQCSKPCCMKTWDNEDVIREMVERQQNMEVPKELIPVCPECGRTITMNLRSDNRFVENEGWYVASAMYQDFIETRSGGKTLFFELGVGYNTPVIIKFPFWEMVGNNPLATYACLNFGQAACPVEIEDRSICIDEDIAKVIKDLKA